MFNSPKSIGAAVIVWLALSSLPVAVHAQTTALSGEAPAVSSAFLPPPVLDYYVSIFGLDSNDGLTPDTPLATIQEAVDRARAGATIHIGSGEYFVCDLVISKKLHFKGETKDAVVRCNAGYMESVIFYIVSGAEETTIENLSLAMMPSAGGGFGAINTGVSMSLLDSRVFLDGVVNADHVFAVRVDAPVEELIVSHSVLDGFSFPVFIDSQVDHLRVDNNTIVVGPTGVRTYAIVVSNPYAFVNGVVRDNSFHGYQYYFFVEGGYLDPSAEVRFGKNRYNGAGRYCFGGSLDGLDPTVYVPHVCWTCAP